MKVKLNNRLTAGLSILASLTVSSSSFGALILGTTIESATVELNPNMGPEKAINGVGLPGGVPSLTGSHDETFSSNWWTG